MFILLVVVIVSVGDIIMINVRFTGNMEKERYSAKIIDLNRRKKKGIGIEMLSGLNKGKKYFIWFTQIDGNNVCLLLYYNKKSKKILRISFHFAGWPPNKLSSVFDCMNPRRR